MGELLEGPVRKAVLPFLAVTAVAWLLVVVAFGIGTYDDSLTVDRGHSSTYPYWMVCFSGPLTLTTALLHALLWKPYSSILGGICSFLSVLFITALGMIAYVHGLSIAVLNAPSVSQPGVDSTDLPAWFNLGFAGSLIGLIAYTPVMILWHFYDIFGGFINTDGRETDGSKSAHGF